jgi:hypothetical protein
VCKGVEEVKRACANTQGCRGFTWEGSRGCGFLKGAVDVRASRRGWGVYVRN